MNNIFEENFFYHSDMEIINNLKKTQVEIASKIVDAHPTSVCELIEQLKGLEELINSYRKLYRKGGSHSISISD